ncbi:Cyclic AMP receptor-like protein A [Lachnellula hyalina]|uniref:Cyclic AMP receptor-like protein A n=1 Tax=Lachnellula hyalina TaxID=1316788 RepID=A0A8H8TZY4_9HELO|nr:Cyclic AMP receptor-like protein A [Lachnellula hyalina]TVY26362.1 Cyclic AMP receptor-like protein A [Lachnellula hyalina]
MRVSDVTERHLAYFNMLERIASSFSLVGICFILVTYCTSTAFHKPINRLVVFASIGNTFTNIATLISREALVHSDGHLCQLQGFLIQMFMPADAYWTFAMACNVYLTFYHHFGAYQLRRLEKWYFLFCYGIPLIPAAVYLVVRTEENGRMYGNATLWCWVATKWDKFRIALFYAPVWAVIILTICIYLRAGRDIWIKRQELRNFPTTDPPQQTQPSPLIPDDHPTFTGKGIRQITQISVNYENASPTDDPVSHLNQPTTEMRYPVIKAENTVTVGVSGANRSSPNPSRWSSIEKHDDSIISATSTVPISVPQPANAPSRNHTSNESNTAIWSYTKVSMLFFIAMMVTWIPSSANRVYSTIHPNEISLPLEYASALVLPLQGFWNCIIYATTSLQPCREFWAAFCGCRCFGTSNVARFVVDNDREHHGAERRKSSRRSISKSLLIDTYETELQARKNDSNSF